MTEGERRESGREGLGILSTLKEALDEAIAEARDKGGISAEKAREAMRVAVARARDAAGEARERLDFITQQDFQEVRDSLNELKVRLENLERRSAQDPAAGPSRPEGGGTGPTGGVPPFGTAPGAGGEAPPGSGPTDL